MLSVIDIVNNLSASLIENLITKYGDRFPEPARKLLNKLGFIPDKFEDELRQILSVSLTNLFDEYPVLIEYNLSETIVLPLLTQAVAVSLYEGESPDIETLRVKFDGIKEHEWELVALERTRKLDLDAVLESFLEYLDNAIMDAATMSDRAVMKAVSKRLARTEGLLSAQMENVISEFSVKLEQIQVKLARISVNRKDDSNAKPRVLISYARSDGEKFATDLYSRLEAEEITLWQDQARTEDDTGWWKQVTDVLDHVEIMVLIVTPDAIASSAIRKEWRYARQQGVCVYATHVPESPVDIDVMPRWIRNSKFYIIEKEWETFVNHLKAPCTTTRIPFMAPDLLENFVKRPAKFDILKEQLLNKNLDSSKGHHITLKGPGGFGKTTLATALCHDEDIQTAFDDGILWVTLGENPINILDKINTIINTLTDRRFDFTSIEDASRRLKLLLSERQCLIVLDDVWRLAELEPFFGKDRCTRIITTRDSVIASQADELPFLINEMLLQEAIQVLLNHLPRKYVPNEVSIIELQKLASRLGKWPLLVEIFGMTLRQEIQHGSSLEMALQFISDGLEAEGLTAFDASNPEHRNQALYVSMNVSLSLYEEHERERLYELSIFPNNVPIPEYAVVRLWSGATGLSEFESRKLLRRFAGHFFHMRVYETDQITYLLFHDAVFEYLRNQLATDKWQQTHNNLLVSYNPQIRQNWWEIQLDDYLYHYLVYHLIEADRKPELIHLLVESASWKNEKFKVLGNNQSFIADIELAIQCFEQSESSNDFTYLVKFHGQLQAVFAHAGIYTDNYLRILASIGHIEQALNYARLRPEIGGVFDGIVSIYEAIVNNPNNNITSPLPSIRNELDKLLNNLRGDEESLVTLGWIYFNDKLYKDAEKQISFMSPHDEALNLHLELATTVSKFDEEWGDELFAEVKKKIYAIDFDPYYGDHKWKFFILKLIHRLVISHKIKRAHEVLSEASEYLDEYEITPEKNLIEVFNEFILSNLSKLPEYTYGPILTVLLQMLLKYEKYDLLAELLTKSDEFYVEEEMIPILFRVGQQLLEKHRMQAITAFDLVISNDIYGFKFIEFSMESSAIISQIDQGRADTLLSNIYDRITSTQDIKEEAYLLAKFAGICAKTNAKMVNSIVDKAFSTINTIRDGWGNEEATTSLTKLAIELTKGHYSNTAEVISDAQKAILSLKDKAKMATKMQSLAVSLVNTAFIDTAALLSLVNETSYESVDADGWLLARIGISIILLKVAHPKAESYFDSLIKDITDLGGWHRDEGFLKRISSKKLCVGLLSNDEFERVEQYIKKLEDDNVKYDAVELLVDYLSQHASKVDALRIMNYINDEKRKEKIRTKLETESHTNQEEKSDLPSLSTVSSVEMRGKYEIIQSALKLKEMDGSGYKHEILHQAKRRYEIANELIQVGELQIAEKVVNGINPKYFYARDDTWSTGANYEAVRIREKSAALLVKAYMYAGNYFKARDYSYDSGLSLTTLQQISYDVALDMASSGNFRQALRAFGMQNLNRYIEFIADWLPELSHLIFPEEDDLRLPLILGVLGTTKWASINWAITLELLSTPPSQT